jgi:hypothetical protein
MMMTTMIMSHQYCPPHTHTTRAPCLVLVEQRPMMMMMMMTCTRRSNAWLCARRVMCVTCA